MCFYFIVLIYVIESFFPDHLTSFALLLNGANNSNDCSDDEDYALAWVSLALIIAAIICVCFGVLLIEVKTRIKLHRTKSELTRISMVQNSMQAKN